MYTIIYLSPTGNTKHLALKLGESLNIEAKHIYALEFVKYEELEKMDHMILMYSIHGFNPPRTVNRFVKNLPLGLYDKVSLIAVGCNDIWVNDAVSSGVKRKLVKKGYDIVVNEVLAMPLTFVMDFPDDVKEKTIDKAETLIIELSDKIKNEEISNRKIKMKSKAITLIGKLEDPAARLFGLELHAKKSCVSCGICWNNCPEHNIKPNKKNKPKFGLSCMMCMRCIYECPEQSITPYISKFLTIKGGYNLSIEKTHKELKK